MPHATVTSITEHCLAPTDCIRHFVHMSRDFRVEEHCHGLTGPGWVPMCQSVTESDVLRRQQIPVVEIHCQQKSSGSKAKTVLVQL